MLSDKELFEVSGGAISGSMISALARGITVLLDLGRSLGTAIRRIYSKTVC